MEIQSLGRRTDFMFAKFSGSVTDRGSYTLIQTPNHPNHYWGNYIVFDHAPRKGSLKEWTRIFDSEFTYYSEPHHYVFTWDVGRDEPGEYQEFLDANYDFESSVVLSAKVLRPPLHLNPDIQIKKICSSQEWEEVIRLQTLCGDPKFINSHYETYKRGQIQQYMEMSEAGMGSWFGAFLNGQLVGDLGIFHDGKLGRYQNVDTHPDFRRRGICGTLVYQAGLTALAEFGIGQLVMEADVHYHAARIYESVGFKPVEVNHSLSWWREKA